MTDHDRQLEELKAMRDEPLLPELQAAVEYGGMMGKNLKHPLVFQIGVHLPGMANRALVAKKKALAEALAEENWHRVVFLHERPYRTQALVDFVVGRDESGVPFALCDLGDAIRELAGMVWTDSENLHQNETEWEAMLRGDCLAMCDDEEGWAELPDVLTVYRGDIDDGGFSWSLDRKIAEFFANRFGTAKLLTGTVNKYDVVGFLTGRGESEILVLDPRKVTIQ